MTSRLKARTFAIENVVFVEFSVNEKRTAAVCMQEGEDLHTGTCAVRLYIEPVETREESANLSASGCYRVLLGLQIGQDRTLDSEASFPARHTEEETS